jgi:hypothetical protein
VSEWPWQADIALFDALSLVRGTARELRRLVRLPPADLA